MIIGSSKSPVLIKKIYLKIWSLRDEIESVIQSRIANGDTTNISVEDLILEYKSQAPQGTNESVTLEVLNGGKSEDSGSEEAADEEPEDSKAEEESTETSSEETEDQEKDKKEEANDSVNIIQRYPTIAEEKIYHGSTVLGEISMEEMHFFSNQNFLEGQSIVLEFLIPKKFVINATVVYSRIYNMKSRIIRENDLKYRVAIKFSFLKAGERTLLRQFVQSIEPDLNDIEVPKKASKAENEGLDDLDDLDL